MRLEQFQTQRNKQAMKLRSIEDIEKRRIQAHKMGRKYEQLAAEHGFITQSHYWVHVHAGLKEADNGE